MKLKRYICGLLLAGLLVLSGCGGGDGTPAREISLTAETRMLTLPVGTYTVKVNRNAYALVGATSGTSRIASVTLLPDNYVQIVLKHPGRTSLKLTYSGSTTKSASAARAATTSTGVSESIGVRVTDAAGTIPGVPGIGGAPGHLTIGSVFYNAPSYETTFASYPVDMGYLYLGKGFGASGWYNDWPGSGGRVANVVKAAQSYGMIQTFVYYQIPGEVGDSAPLAYANINDKAYMALYFTDLMAALKAMNSAAATENEPVVVIFEPDFLGYMMGYSNYTPDPSGDVGPGKGAYAAARTVSAKGMASVFGNTAFKNASGTTLSASDIPGLDPADAATLRGFVLTINYLAKTYCPNCFFGWEIAHWGSGQTSGRLSGGGVMHVTDGMTDPASIQTARTALTAETGLITTFALSAGIAESGASFVALDKHGVDGGRPVACDLPCVSDPGYKNPAASQWFWNATQWNNYVTLITAVKKNTTLPVILWQMPVGHLNGSTMTSGVAWASPTNPAVAVDQGKPFPDALNQDLPGNEYGSWEDSSTSFFFGDVFNTTSSRASWFGLDDPDPRFSGQVAKNGTQVTWKSAFKTLANAGVISVQFGAGVGNATSNTAYANPLDPTDNFFWFEKARRYLENPQALP